MWKRLNILYKLLIINIAVFLVINIVSIIFYLLGKPEVENTIASYISVPSNTHDLIRKFWTPFTYMFVHQTFWHILGNMLWLYFIGLILMDTVNQQDFLWIYILGGLSGAAFYIIAFNIFPAFSVFKDKAILLGASGAVTAIVIATATIRPNEVIYFFGIVRIRLFIIAIFMLVYDVLLLKGDNAGGQFAHLGGALYGFIFGWQLKKGRNIQSFVTLGSPASEQVFKRNRKLKIAKNNLRSKDDYEFNRSTNDIRIEIDRLLDKISQHGYNSLSKKEKDFLKKYSKNI